MPSLTLSNKIATRPAPAFSSGVAYTVPLSPFMALVVSYTDSGEDFKHKIKTTTNTASTEKMYDKEVNKRKKIRLQKN